MKSAALDTWIVEQRPPRAVRDPLLPYLFFQENECSSTGEVLPVNTVFLTNRECPWRCLMCDLWKNTLTTTVPGGAIPAQIQYALARLSATRHIKLYNSGSFFDPRAIPIADYDAITDLLTPFEHVIVESHPSLVNQDCLRFSELLQGSLEVAMGLETVHPEVLPRLNKRMTLDQFGAAAEMLHTSAIDVRAFILVKPPFITSSVEAVYWAQRSLDFALVECGATVATLIATRGGNGAMEALTAVGDFAPPRLEAVEAALEYGLSLHRGRVFVDLWDLERFSRCAVCYPARAARLQRMNLTQVVETAIRCPDCEPLR